MGILDIAVSPMIAGVKSWPLHCAHEACNGRSLLRMVSRRRTGINVDKNWYCSSECFEAAAQLEYMRILSSATPVAASTRNRMPLGLLLFSRGIVTDEQLRIALDLQASSGQRIGEILMEMGFATEQQITSAIAAQWGCPVLSVGNRAAYIPVRIPRTLLDLCAMVPLHYVPTGRRLMLGFVDSVDHTVAYAIERMTGCTAMPCFITPGDYRRQLEMKRPENEENEVVFGHQVANPVEMARITRSYAVQIGADEARLGQCVGFCWVRLNGQRQDVDLLFRLQPA